MRPHGHGASPVGPTTTSAPPPATLRLDGTGDPVVAAVADGQSLVVLRTDSLVRASLDGRVRTKHGLTGDAALGAEAPAVALLLDRPRGIGWAVSILERRARVLTFDLTTLRPLRVWENDFIAYDAALLAGRVYAATSEGVAWVDASGRSGHVPHVGGVVSSVAADPARGRLLAVLGHSVLAVTPAGRIEAAATLAPATATVRLVGGAVWVAGPFGERGEADRLDVQTLRAIRAVPLRIAAQVVGTGPASLYVVSSGEPDGLWCVDVRSGLPAQVSANAAVTVTATATRTFAASGSGIVPVSAC